MKGTFPALVAISILPWLYVVVSLLVDLDMQGFGYLPFFGLLFLKETALKAPKARAELVSRNSPYWKDALVVVAAVLLTVAVVLASRQLMNLTGVYKQFAWILFAFFVLGSISWDVGRAYRMRRYGRKRAG